jgi:hypothetical protein
MRSILKARFAHRGLPIVLALLMLAGGAAAQPIGDRPIADSSALAPPSQTPPDLDVISLGMEFVTSPGDGSFFDQYLRLGGKANELSGFVMPAVTIRLASRNALKVVMWGGFAHGSFVDIYGVRDSSEGGRPGSASLVEDFTVTAVPVMAGLEYTPIRSQFSSYVGLTAGGAINSVTWTTATQEQTFSDFYRPTTNLKGLSFSPAFRIYAGVDLRFDRYLSGRSPFRGIFLEGSYFVLPVARDYFSAIRSGGRGLPRVPDADRASMNLGGLTFTLGVNLQYARR